MHEYFHPSSSPVWVNDDWLRKNTQWDPESTSVETLAENGFYQLKSEPVVDHDYHLYDYIWSDTVVSPYCIRSVDYEPKPLPEAKAWMLETYPDYEAEIEAATTVDELQQILDSIPQS